MIVTSWALAGEVLDQLVYVYVWVILKSRGYSLYESMNGEMNWWMDEWMDGWMDG